MKLMLAFFAWIALNLIFNAIAQKAYPTKVTDSFGRKVGYWLVFTTIPSLLLGTVLLLGHAAGY